MRHVTRVVLLALVLQVTIGANIAALAQTRPAAQAAAGNTTQYRDELKQFDEFVAGCSKRLFERLAR